MVTPVRRVCSIAGKPSLSREPISTCHPEALRVSTTLVTRCSNAFEANNHHPLHITAKVTTINTSLPIAPKTFLTPASKPL